MALSNPTSLTKKLGLDHISADGHANVYKIAHAAKHDEEFKNDLHSVVRNKNVLVYDDMHHQMDPRFIAKTWKSSYLDTFDDALDVPTKAQYAPKMTSSYEFRDLGRSLAGVTHSGDSMRVRHVLELSKLKDAAEAHHYDADVDELADEYASNKMKDRSPRGVVDLAARRFAGERREPAHLRQWRDACMGTRPAGVRTVVPKKGTAWYRAARAKYDRVRS